ncbi:MAG: FAD-binding protein [Armatimonadetes bacterium]|nr:FAD-binding protein [Armatimonadota bacterium]
MASRFPPQRVEVIKKALLGFLPLDGVLWRPRELEVYSYDAARDVHRPDLVVLPRTTEEVLAAVAVCRDFGVPVTPRGSATSLSGGPVPVRGGVVLSLTRMNRILEIDEGNLRAVVQPGVINQDLADEVARRGLMYAPDPASQIACSLGGNVAENAGGPHCLKYGVTANHVTGLVAVTADASLLRLGGQELLSPGLDLRGLLIGSEGTLAVVTEITCRLLPAPPAVVAALACFASVEDAADAVSDIIAAGMLPATIEMIDRTVIQAIEMYDRIGYPQDVEAVLVLEVDGLPGAVAAQVTVVEEICRARRALRFEWAEAEAERERLWRGRKGATAALSFLAPAKLSTDVSVPRSRLAEALSQVAEISRRFDIPIGNVFHAGDGNLHPQVLFDPRDPDQVRRATAADEAITEMALRFGGVITGEHGIGSEKRKFMPLAYTEDELRAMAWVKEAFDPAGILNPDKVLPEFSPEKPPARVDPAGTSGLREGFARPQSLDEVASIHRACEETAHRLNVSAHSLMHSDDALDVDLSCLTGVVAYDPGNLTVTVRAGTPIEELQQVLAESRQTIGAWRRLSGTSVGALAATAWPTAAISRYGGARDFILGMTVVVRGRLLRLGSSCVKNASGYALERLFTGSFSCLGVIAEVTLRTHPLPDAEQSLVLVGAGEALRAFVAWLLVSPLPFEHVIVRPLDGDGCAQWCIQVAVSGFGAEVQEALSILRPVARDCGLVWADSCFLSFPPSADVPGLGASQESPPVFFCYPLRMALDEALRLRERLQEYWPLAGILRTASTGETISSYRLATSAEDLFVNHPAAETAILTRLKSRFDPFCILPPWFSSGA